MSPESVPAAGKSDDRDCVRISPRSSASLPASRPRKWRDSRHVGSIVDGIAEKLGRRDFSKGVKVRLEGEAVTLELSVIVDYGIRIMEAAQKLKQKVRATVEEVTGLPVAAINIHVIAINLPQEKSEDTIPEKDGENA